MSTATRKARKRELNHLRSLGAPADLIHELRFEHPVKHGTPPAKRAIGPSLGPNGTDYMQTTRSRRGLRKLNDRLMVTAEDSLAPEREQRGEPVEYIQEQPVQAEKAEQDPKPYRVGRKRYSIYDVINRFHQADNEDAEAIWSPRKGYAQFMASYDHDGVIPEAEA